MTYQCKNLFYCEENWLIRSGTHYYNIYCSIYPKVVQSLLPLISNNVMQS